MRRLVVLLVLLAVAASAPVASAADSSAAPSPLAFNVPAVEDITSYGVETGEQNTFSPLNQTCDVGRPVGVAHTAWFTVQGNGAPVTVSTKDSSIDTSMFVYSGSPTGGLVICSDDGPGTGIFASATFNAATGTTYFVQAGRFCDASFATACNPTPPTGGPLTVLATTPAASGAATGQRAAALKKCKKQKFRTKKKLKKCKQRAKKLPL